MYKNRIDLVVLIKSSHQIATIKKLIKSAISASRGMTRCANQSDLIKSTSLLPSRRTYRFCVLDFTMSV